jgi:2-methylcitrate dehydratase PrpD
MLTSLQLSRFVVEHQVDSATQQAAMECFLDTLACIIAGSVEDGVTRVESLFPISPEKPHLPGFRPGSRYRPEDAAMLYGTAAHILDYDDVSMLAICHPSAPVLAAILASRPWPSVKGTELCDALAIGTEVMIRLGQAIGLRHYALGFHSTSTLGVFGAVAAVARMRRLSVDQTASSLAMAASLASGLRINFGTTVKSMHVGIAAANALRAVDWAVAGIRGSAADLFATNSILATFSGGQVSTWPDAIKLGQPFAMHEPGFERKRYACCYMLHKVVALGLQMAHEGLRLEHLARLDVEMPSGGTLPLIYPKPTTGIQGLFSGQYALLTAISDRTVNFESFTDKAVSRPHIRARLPDVTLSESGDELRSSAAIEAAPVTIRATLVDGTTRIFVQSTSPGSPADPFTLADLQAKWSECLKRAVPFVQATQATLLFQQGTQLCADISFDPWVSSLWTLLHSAPRDQSRVA